MYGSGNVELLKRFSPQLIILLVMCLISSVGIITEKAITAGSNAVTQQKTIIIDAGHGGLTNTIN